MRLTRRWPARDVALLAGRAVGLAFLASCATAPPTPWPPAASEPRRTVVISVDTWHAVIAFPFESGARFEEWGYAERAWYLAARQATRSIPIVAFDLESDPVAKGWVRGRAGTSRASSSICGKSALTGAALVVDVVCSAAWL